MFAMNFSNKGGVCGGYLYNDGHSLWIMAHFIDEGSLAFCTIPVCLYLPNVLVWFDDFLPMNLIRVGLTHRNNKTLSSVITVK